MPSWWARAALRRSCAPISAIRVTDSMGAFLSSPIVSNADTCPTDTCGSRNVAPSAAMAMSASATKWRPPPAQVPLTAAITGLVTPQCHEVIRSAKSRVRREPARSASGSLASCFTSSPVWKALPLPVLTMALTDVSASNSAHAASNSTNIRASMALPASGRLNTSHPTGPSVRTSSVS